MVRGVGDRLGDRSGGRDVSEDHHGPRLVSVAAVNGGRRVLHRDRGAIATDQQSGQAT
jgi:hypothetical protein